MKGYLSGVTDDIVIISAISICILITIVSFIAAARSRKMELLDKRLARSLSNKLTVPVQSILPDRIELEREDTGPGPLWKEGGPQSIFGTLFGKRLIYAQFIKAGINPRLAQRYFLWARVFCFCISACGVALLLDSLLSGIFNSYTCAAIIFIVGIAGSFLPHFLLRYQIRQRQRKIERAMPDMVDLLVLCVEAGLTLEVAIARAIDGLEPFAPEIALELKITLSELRILPDKSMALTNLERRTASKSLKYFVLSLRQSERYGTSIAGALKVVARENRKHVILELENNAARMPALLSIPLILFILPPVVALSAGPGFALMMRSIGG